MFPFTLTSAVPVLVIISWLDNIIGWVPWDWWLSAGQRSHPGSQRCHCNMAVTCSSMFEKSTFIYLFDICKLRMKMKTNFKMFLKTAAFRISLIFISACCTWCAFRRLLLNYNYQNLQWLLHRECCHDHYQQYPGCCYFCSCCHHQIALVWLIIGNSYIMSLHEVPVHSIHFISILTHVHNYMLIKF